MSLADEVRSKPFWPAAALGIGLALVCFVMLAIGECLPRDDSPAMLRCDQAKSREVWLFPVLIVCQLVMSKMMHAHGILGGRLLAGSCGLLALIVLPVLHGWF